MNLADTPGYLAGFPDTLNLRDLGGLPADGGRHVRHGLLYRSSALCGLDGGQLRTVDSFGLRLVIDLRAAGETRGAADYVPPGCGYRRVGGMVGPDGTEVDFSPASIRTMTAHLAETDDMGSFMRGLYLSMPFGNRAVHTLVGCLAHDRLPVLFHCTAGKDRTGVCAAIALVVLGVPDDAIMADFLLTNEYRREIIENVPADAADRIPGVDAEAWAKANGVNADDLAAVLAAIDERYATREAYLEAEFGLAGDDLASIRARCLR